MQKIFVVEFHEQDDYSHYVKVLMTTKTQKAAADYIESKIAFDEAQLKMAEENSIHYEQFMQLHEDKDLYGDGFDYAHFIKTLWLPAYRDFSKSLGRVEDFENIDIDFTMGTHYVDSGWCVINEVDYLDE